MARTAPDPEWVVCDAATRMVVGGWVACPVNGARPVGSCLTCRHLITSSAERSTGGWCANLDAALPDTVAARLGPIQRS